MNVFARPLLLLTALILSPLVQADSPTVEPLTFGIVPQQSAARLARQWVPLLRRLGEVSGVPMRFATAPDIQTFERRLAAGEYDLAYMNPYHYEVFHRAPGYRALAKQRGKRIVGIVVVAEESPYATLADLRDAELAFPSPAAFAASVLPRAELNRAGIPFTAKYVASHDSVYRNVADGRLAAGGGILRTFNNADPQVRQRLRVLWRSRGYTPHAFAAHPRVDAGRAARIAAALFAMGDDPLSTRLLASIGFSDGIEPAEDREWDDVRALRIDLLDPLAGEE